MRPTLTLIQGGLRHNETLLTKLLNRPADFPEVIFQRVLKMHEPQLTFLQTVTVLRMRADAAYEREMAARRG